VDEQTLPRNGFKGSIWTASPCQDFGAAAEEATEVGKGEFCADAATGFFAPSSQLNLLVLSKMR
jgi:hypothetical protein